ncbi:probable serine/threonine-protein kinase clkA [Panonychus citri]|uniref:probable serine/threonine-protein kinase clkA n=1 Tax=Panonychus citri TaxID=50023 RepID=UPI002308161F|nr:probable serine/threonine-protein kinase clkA [Panonychus citri]
MSFWPGKGLFNNRNKRQQRVRLVWTPPEKFDDYNNGANQIEKPKQSNCPVENVNGNGISVDSNSTISDGKNQRKVTKNGDSGRGKKKKRNCKATNGRSSISDDQERLNGEHENGGKGNGKINGHKDECELNKNVNNGEQRSRTRSFTKSKKSEELACLKDSREKEKNTNGNSMRRNKHVNGDDNHGDVDNDNDANHDDDDDDDNWDEVRDAIGPVTRCSSSSSLSSSCSNSSLIKHYTNVIMNCCDNHFKEDCDFVRAKIDRILKAHWKDRLNRLKVKMSPSNEDTFSEKTDSQPSKQSSPATDSIAFELRPARLPLNKKTWTKLRRSNRNSDWLLNEET